MTLINEAQERDWYKLIPQYHSLRMNYSIFIMEMKETMSMEENGQPGAALAAPPLLSSQSLDLFRVFTVPMPPPREIPRGYIVSFRLRRFHRGKDCSNWTHEGGRWAPPCGPATWPHGGSSFLPRGVSRWLLLAVFYFLKKMMWQKDWVRVTSERSLKLTYMQKQENLLYRVKTKINGII
jgi:hypothetical protein